MNILIEPIYSGLTQSVLSLLIISGIIFFGEFFNKFFLKKYNYIFFNFLIGLILSSQLLKIFAYLGFFNSINLILSYTFLIFGVYNLINLKTFYKNYFFFSFGNKIEILIFISISLLFLTSIAPPTMADALDYHYGLPLYLLSNNHFPDYSLWLNAIVAGNGDIFNAIGLYLGTDNFGSLIQLFSLMLFFLFIKKNVVNKDKVNFIIIFILSSPTILQLISGPKFLLAPQLMTTLALYFYLKLKKIDVVDFIFISILLMGAAQFKSSFIISGFLIGFLVFIKSFKLNKVKTIINSFLLVFIFFLPTAIWNFFQVSSFQLINIFTSMPNEMMNDMKTWKENDFIFPVHLFIPSTLGKISTIIGLQFFLLFFFFKRSKESKIIFQIILTTIFIHYFLGMNVGRMYFEYILWSSVAFIFIDQYKFNFRFFTIILLPLFLFVTFLSVFFVTTSIPSIFSNKHRNQFMINNSSDYEAIQWVNDTLPINGKVISDLRSVAFLKKEFASTDWLVFDVNEIDLMNYYKILKKQKMNYIVLRSNTLSNHLLKRCVGNKFAQSKNFTKSTRNPFNRGIQFSLTIYEFEYKKLPNCVKK